MSTRRMLVVASLLLAAAGCSGSGSPSSTTDQAGDQLFTRTVVTFHPDGTQTVKVGPITRAEQLEEQRQLRANIAARKNGLSVETLTLGGNGPTSPTPPAGCAGNSNMAEFFSGTGFTGNEICFYNAGSSLDYAYLPNYSNGSGTWSGGAILSFANQNEDTALSTKDPPLARGSTCTDLGTNNQNQNTGFLVAQDYVWMEPDGTSICTI